MDEKKQKIKSKLYRQFLDKGIISTINEQDIKKVIRNIDSNFKGEAAALIICLYYTGARPNEVLRLKSKDIKKAKRYIIIEIQGSKGGLPRSIYLPYKLELVKTLYIYAKGLHPERFMFYNFTSHYTRTKIGKKGVITTKETSDKLRYHIYKWFSILGHGNIPPYFLRHNRFSKLTLSGVADRELMMLKGSKTLESIKYYQHMSTESAQKIARKID